jgi:predicted RNase H-like nuclease (RuvC/YqgF family)
MNIQDEAYSEAMDEIARLKRLLELRDTKIGALRREISRRNAEAMDEILRLKKILELRDTEIGALRREIIRRNAEIDKLKTRGSA